MIYNYTGFLTVTQAARSINISRQGIMKAIKQNRINGYRCGNVWLVRCEDFDKFRSERKRQ